MHKNIFIVAVLFSSAVASISAQEESFSVPIPPETKILDTLNTEHPRLIVPAGEEKRVLELIAKNKQAAEIFGRIKEKGDRFLDEKPVTYDIQVRSQPTILMTSRKAQDRIVTLATLYRLTKEKKYLDRAVTEMTTVCRFKDWNHRCFLDTAEMLFAVAVGYDWLYHELADQQRTLFVESMRDKGLLPGKEGYRKKVSWTRTRNNWNQVCAGGLTVGALAVADREPELAAHIVNHAATAVQTAMREFAPDGGTGEGPTYWAYAVNFNVYMLAALESALGTDFGLSGFPGFDRTGNFRIQFITPMKTYFTFGDSGGKADSNQSMYWLGKKFDKPFYDRHDRTLFEPSTHFALWWFPDENDTGNGMTNEPTAAHFRRVGVVFMRSDWQPDAVFVGMKGGSNAVGHSHLELGHFQLIADDRLWCGDLGNVPYTRDYFRGDTRWTFYRATNLAHNVPHIDGKLQDPKGEAPVTFFETTLQKTVTEVDLTGAYRGQVEKASRRLTLENRTVTVEDVFEGVDGEMFTWQIHAPVRMLHVNKNDPRRVDMQHLYKRMRMEIVEPKDGVFEIEEITIPEGQPPVKDVIRVVLRRKVTAEPIRVIIRFTPQPPGKPRPAAAETKKT